MSCSARWRSTRPTGCAPPSWPGRGRLTVPVGVVDRPYEQRRDPMMVELAGAGGNVVIVGRSLSGKSTMLRTLLASLALTHTPREVQFFCLDFGGGALRSMERLPHLAGVAGRRDVEAVRRTVAEVVAILDEREARFAQHGIDSVAELPPSPGRRRVRRRPVRRRVPGGGRLEHPAPGVRGAGADDHHAGQPGPRLRRARGAHRRPVGGDPDQHAGSARHQVGAAPRRRVGVRDRPPGGERTCRRSRPVVA